MESLDDELKRLLALPEEERWRELILRTISARRALRYMESRVRIRDLLVELLLERVRLLEDTNGEQPGE